MSGDIPRRFERLLTSNSLAATFPAMSTIAEIEAVLPKLTSEELARVEQAVHNQYRQRDGGIVYDDAHGVVSEADLISSADEAFQSYDRAEEENAKRKAR